MAGHLIVLTFQGSERAAAALEAVQRLAAHGWIDTLTHVLDIPRA